MTETPRVEQWHGRDIVRIFGWAWGDLYAERTYLAGKGEDHACIHCGRKTSRKNKAMGILISEGGSAAILPEDYDTYPHDGGEMGWFAVGRECIKAIPSAYHVEDPYQPDTE